jgi:hypothetical protein
MKLHRFLAVFLLAGLTAAAQTELRLPACTAYLDPLDGAPEISPRQNIDGWDDPTQKILWFGEIKTPGKLDCTVELQLSAGGFAAPVS